MKSDGRSCRVGWCSGEVVLSYDGEVLSCCWKLQQSMEEGANGQLHVKADKR
jgi:hypothetical protein